MGLGGAFRDVVGDAVGDEWGGKRDDEICSLLEDGFAD